MHNTSAIRFASYLSPNMYPTYEYIAHYVGDKVGRPATLTVGQSFAEFATGQVDVGFICGLPYVHLADSPTCSVELLAAPVLQGERYQRKPIYFSDVIVRSDSLYTSFDDLQGCVWAYNQKTSHSGCNLVCYSLLVQGKSPHYFGKTVETGSHRQSVQLVLEEQVDAAAIDSHMLDVFFSEHTDVARKLRIIDMLGPSSIPPVVAAKSLDNDLKCRLREALISMHLDPEAARRLHAGLIERFVIVADDDYEDIRTMFARVQAVEFPFR